MKTLSQKIRQYRLEKCRAELIYFGLENSNRTLEVGSGSGDEMTWCIAGGSYFTAVEITSENCKLIHERAKKEKVSSHVDVIRADGALLPFREGVFDVVFCKAVLHHIRKSLQAVYEMQRVTHKDGIVAAIDEPNAFNPLWHIAEFGMKNRWLKETFSSFLPGYTWEWEVADWASPFYSFQLASYFRKANLNKIKIRNLLLPYYIDSPFLFKIYLLSVKSLEKTPFSYLFGQLFVVGKK